MREITTASSLDVTWSALLAKEHITVLSNDVLEASGRITFMRSLYRSTAGFWTQDAHSNLLRVPGYDDTVY